MQWTSRITRASGSTDVLKMKRADIQDGALWIRQAKTKAKLRIAIEGELAAVIERIGARAVDQGAPLTTARGQPLPHRQLSWLFDRARDAAKVDFQFRDLRAKAATDMENLEHAQKLLGHVTRDMTEREGHGCPRVPNATDPQQYDSRYDALGNRKRP